MQKHIIRIVTLALVFAFAQPAPPAAAEGEKAAFRAAYKAYQEAVEARDAEAAVAAAHEALDLGKLVLPDDSPSLAALYVNYGTTLLDSRRKLEAIEPLDEGLERYEDLYGKDDERLIDPLWLLIEAGKGGGQSDSTVPLAYRLHLLVAKHHGKDSLAYADTALELGKVLFFSFSKRRRATRYFKESYEAYARVYGQPAYKTGIAAFWLGKAAEQSRSGKGAEERYLEALEIFETTAPTGHELQLLAHTYLIKLYEERGQSDEATLHCQAISQLRPLAGVDGYTPLYKKPPNYPRSAQIAGRGGFVLVDFTVTADGSVANATVVESKGGKSFEREALKAVLGFRYAPAVQDGELIETTGVKNLITFQMVD